MSIAFVRACTSSCRLVLNRSRDILSPPLRHFCAPNADSSAGEKGIIIGQGCVKRLHEIMKDKNEEFLRLSVDSGGCSGFEYKFGLDTNVNDDDVVFSEGGVRVVVDSLSLQFVRGATVDFKEELIRSAFKIVDNPIAEQGCSCGVSFAVKMD